MSIVPEFRGLARDSQIFGVRGKEAVEVDVKDSATYQHFHKVYIFKKERRKEHLYKVFTEARRGLEGVQIEDISTSRLLPFEYVDYVENHVSNVKKQIRLVCGVKSHWL